MCERCQEFYEKRAREFKDLAGELQKVIKVHMDEVATTGDAELFQKTGTTDALQEIQFTLRELSMNLVARMEGSKEALKLGTELATEAMEALADVTEAMTESLERGEEKEPKWGGRLGGLDLHEN